MTKQPPNDPSENEIIELNDDQIEEINSIPAPPLPPPVSSIKKSRISIEDKTIAYPKPTFKEIENLEKDIQEYDNTKLSLSVEKLIKTNIIESDVGNYLRGLISLIRDNTNNSL